MLVPGSPLFPSTLDGSALIRPRAFRIACRLRLGVAVWDKGASCPMCKQTLDIMGDHAICCTTNGDLIVRHNRIRDLVDSIAHEGHLSPVLEKKGILGESKQSGRRPGDVTIPLWCEGKGLCVDVAVTCPFSKSNLYRDSPAEYCATYLKHRKYDSDFVSTNFDFSALIFETSGAVNREGKEFLAQLFRFAARYSGTHLSVYSGRAWARLSCALQSAVAQSVLNRSLKLTRHQRIYSTTTEESFSSVSVAPRERSVAGSDLVPVPESIVLPVRLVPLVCFFAFFFWRLRFARHLAFTSLTDSEAVDPSINFSRLPFVRPNSSPAVASCSPTPPTAAVLGLAAELGLAAPFFSCKKLPRSSQIFFPARFPPLMGFVAQEDHLFTPPSVASTSDLNLVWTLTPQQFRMLVVVFSPSPPAPRVIT